MDERKWIDRSQPQTLQTAVVLLYINAVFSLLWLLQGWWALITILGIAEAFGAFWIANEKRMGYYFSIGCSAALAAIWILYLVQAHGAFSLLLNAMFAVAVFVALIHPMSRSYQKIWFR